MKHFKLNKKSFTGGFAATLSVAFLAIFAIPAVSSIVFLQSGKTAAIREIERNDKTILNAVHSYIDREISQTAPLAASVAKTAELKSFARAVHNGEPKGEITVKAYKLAETLKIFMANNPLAEEIYVSFGDEDLTVSSVMLESNEAFFEKTYGKSGADYETWCAAVGKKSYGKYILAENEGGGFIDFFHNTSFFENAGDLSATVAVRISQKHFADYISSVYDFDMKGLYIVDKNNRTVFKYGSDSVPRLDYDEIESFAKSEKKDGCMLTSLKATNNWKYVLCTRDRAVDKKIYFNRVISVLSIVSYLLALAVFFTVFMLKNLLPVKRIFGLINNDVKDKYEFLENITREYGTYKAYHAKYQKANNEEKREAFYNGLVSYRQNAEKLYEKAQSVGVTLLSDEFVVLIIDIYNFERLFEEDGIEEDEKYKSACFIVKNIFEEIFEPLGTAYVFRKNDRSVCVLNLKEALPQWKEDVRQCIDYARSVIETHFDMCFSIDISEVCRGADKVTGAYRDAIMLNEQTRFYRTGEIAFCKNTHSDTPPKEIGAEITENFVQTLQNGDVQTATAQFEKIAEAALGHSNGIKDDFMLFAVKMINVMRAAQGESAANGRESLDIVNRILKFDTYEQCMREFRELIAFICNEYSAKKAEYIEEVTPTKAEQLVENVKKYVAENFRNPSICLTGIGDRLGYAPYYMARAFKNATGEGVPDYISRYRVAKAKELLAQDCKIPISKLYLMTGFGSERTFMRAFMRYENISVGDYKKLIWKKRG